MLHFILHHANTKFCSSEGKLYMLSVLELHPLFPCCSWFVHFGIKLHVIILLFSSSFPWVMLFSLFQSIVLCMLR